MSQFGWLDTSSRDRRKMLDVIQLFQQKETVDELGIGGIRDAIADWLAPGTSTIQTRARYFFFLPWIYRSLEPRRVTEDRIAAAARAAEVELISALAKSNDSRGTIGIEARGQLRRLPSEIYWAGLKRLGFRIFSGTRERYHRVIAGGARPGVRDDSGDVGELGLSGANWNPHIPEPPREFPRDASFALRATEAQFFLSQLELHAHGSLLHFLVECRDWGQDATLPWEHPACDRMPAELKRWLDHARCYSELMHGAALLYNLMLAELREEGDLLAEYQARFAEWTDVIRGRRQAHLAWAQAEFWSLVRRERPRIPMPAQEFSSRWITIVLTSDGPKALATERPPRELIAQRESRLKGPRARLQSRAHLELWGGASGAGQLDYRWGNTQTLAADIIQGLSR
jgi:hypothetical protein